jgi:hypothetical protein
MSSFQELQQKHIDLLRHYETNKESADFIKQVREYIEQVLSASRQIGDSRERNQLRANLRFWGAYIYDNTGTYPNLTLLPSEAAAEPTPAPQPAPNPLNARLITVAVLVVLCIVVLLVAFPRARPYSQTPPITSTPIDSTALFSTPADSMTDIASFATGTVMAIGPTLTPIPTSTDLPMTGGGGMLGRAFSSTDIQDGTDCSSHRINIQVIHDFAADQPVEPAVLTVSEEGTFRNIVERQIPLNQGRLLEDVRREIDMEIDIPEASGSYLVYIDHPRFTFDSFIIQHLPGCQGNLINIAYDVPTNDYDELQSRPKLGLQIGLMAWGPYPSTEPEAAPEGIARLHVSRSGSEADNIFWISDGSGDFQLVQNDEFIADTMIDYSIGVTSEGQTVSIPFTVYAPYLEYLRNK